MPTAKCAICGKSAYPLESVTAIEKVYHKSCFKCATCHLQLTLTTFKGLEGQVYCMKHVPQAKATAVTDTVAMKTAQAAPKKTAEGLGTVQKGTGEKPKVGTDTVAMKTAKSAPKKTAEGLGIVQKGTGGKPSIVVFGAEGGASPRGEQPAGEEQPAYEEQPPQEEQPAYEEQPPQEEVPQEEAPQEEAQYEEQPPQEEVPQEQPAEGSSW